jgi:hypothetical protein
MEANLQLREQPFKKKMFAILDTSQENTGRIEILA